MKLNKLDEINKIAAAKCSKGLAKLLGKPAGVAIAKVEVKKVVELSSLIGKEVIVAGMHIGLSGDVRGSSLLILQKEDATAISDLMMGRPQGTTRRLAPIDEIALKEMSNIVSGNYMGVLSNSLQLKIVVGLPTFCCDIFGAIIQQVITKSAMEASNALVAQVVFSFKPHKVKGYLLNVIFGSTQMQAILRALENA